jgi:hypothetical protein
MNILKKPEQAVAPVNQPHPDHFPRFYRIPETKYIPRRHHASNASHHNHSSPKHTKLKQETRLHKFIRQEKEIFQETCADAWTAIKQAGISAVHWLARWVILPLSVASTFWISIGNPAELPL